MVGNPTFKNSNNSLSFFSLLKGFGINIHLRKQIFMVEVLWCPPARGWIKCNIHGVPVGSPLLATCGGLNRDEHANHLLSFCVFLEAGTPVFVEFMAAIIAIEKAKRMQWSKLWLKTDCILVVKAFSNPNLVPWKIKSSWLSCWAYTINIGFMITHIFREVNFCADFLANIGLMSKSFTWYNFEHRDITADYLLDKAGTPMLRLCS
ncbi:uncharacterized protein LOC131650562 [Vicia villosa]|uniref:uncharacterized protein LOC131650562 n=1 Tax=Vicia villosa TaxID=3911 RepID=UPI00273AF974|nr:uncharacterized protein LOC131650562 [Vicia villosa]